MEQVKYSKGAVLALCVAALVASGCGLLIPDFYGTRSNAITTDELAGQDSVTFILGGVLLIAVLFFRKRRVFPVTLTGLLIYLCYTYSYYAFGLITSRLTLLYYLAAGLSFYSLLSVFASVVRSSASGTPAFPGTSIGVYLIVIVSIVALMEFRDVIAKTVGSPERLNSKSVYYVLDLVFLFPAMVIAGLLCIRGRAPGVFFSGAFLIKTLALMPALIIADVVHYLRAGSFLDFTFDIIAFLIMMSAVVFWWLYCRKIRRMPPGSRGV